MSTMQTCYKASGVKFSLFKDERDHWFLSITYLCKHCYQTFIVLHTCIPRRIKSANGIPSYFYEADIIYMEPNRFKAMEFDQKSIPCRHNLSRFIIRLLPQNLPILMKLLGWATEKR